ncbi:DUF2635 domain-containing protein [Citrobacter werkmanii]|uniref:DUF2635 domain-containing protein n=1 Tax=Citrobacter sp. Cf122 TaxID=2985072 RepID=UPI00190361A8|nr:MULTISPECIES: DUF2635 domain-containing protein [Citrobacter]MBJ9599714.1 DUF2635 domain-containing protein [Citrobacter werkmanii]MDM3155735.1 DUF2635 domain-containing protein [Citrobacter sp. Cf122]
MFVIPQKGRSVPDPVRGDLLPEKGRNVEKNAYWCRRDAAGDIKIISREGDKNDRKL